MLAQWSMRGKIETLMNMVKSLFLAGLLAFAPGSVSAQDVAPAPQTARSEEHTSELQSLMRSSYAVFCLKKKTIYFYLFALNASILLLTPSHTDHSLALPPTHP